MYVVCNFVCLCNPAFVKGCQSSTFIFFTASITQGSTIGPATYVVTAGDLTAAVSGNSLCKFADDTYLIIPVSSEVSRHTELANIQNWAKRNNLKLNGDKSCEVVFTDSRTRRRHAAEPAPLPRIVHCSSSLKMMDVVIADDFSVTQHVQRLVTSYTLHTQTTRCECYAATD